MKFLPFFILLLIFQRSIRAEDQIVTICAADSNFTSGSQFETNLNILLSNLSTNGLLNRESFYNTSYGDGPDKIYGFSQCMSAASEDTCRRCLVDGISNITKLCPKKREASVRFYDCIMRYSYQPFFSQPNTGLIVYINVPANASNLTIFNQRLGGLMNDLSLVASSPPSMYAQNVTNYSDFGKIYGMAQCTRDLSQFDCNSCLQQMIAFIPTCCNGNEKSSVYTMSCNVRYDTTPFFTLSSSQPPPPPPPPSVASSPTNTSDPTIPQKGSGTPVVAIVIPIVIAMMLLSLAIICFIKRKSKKTSQGRRSDALIGEQEDISMVESLQFDLHTIEIATDNFSENNKLGEGGFGVVYKGKLVDGEEVAVKRLSRASGQGATEFKNEVMLVAKLQHKNLVRLLGFCLDGVEKILIYEYVVNKSLDNYLFDPIKRLLLSWEKRYKIIIGIARGLLYLHEDSQLRIIHRDLKASNILLDSNMNSKIADFGTARLFGVDQTQGNTSIIAGTFGYMAPEYGMYGQFSVKSDVYSFGVLLLEIVSGQKNSSSNQSDNDTNLINLAWRKWSEGTASELMDPIMGESFSRSEVMRCIRIGLLCVQEDLNARPTMSSVVLMLSSSSVTLQSPLPPAFFTSSRMQSNGNSSTLSSRVSEPDKSESDITLLSINEASITDPYPR